jgi:hypothetical protein
MQGNWMTSLVPTMRDANDDSCSISVYQRLCSERYPLPLTEALWSLVENHGHQMKIN